MTAFLSFLNNFAIWIYITGVVGILFGIKMLFDARRAARTTLFTLEQEQASDRAFRAVVVMASFTLLIAAVASINAFVGPAIPEAEPPVEPTDVPYTPPVILPTATLQPTSTPLAPTPTLTRAPTRAVQTAVPVETVPTAELPTPEPTSTPQFSYPPPPLNTPPQGDSIGSRFIRFSWGRNEAGGLDVPELLPPNQFYRVRVTYRDRVTGEPKGWVKCTPESSMDTRTGPDVTEARGNAIDGMLIWYVEIVDAPDTATCETGGGSPISPPSATFTFRLQ